jgi:hypothetical protein
VVAAVIATGAKRCARKGQGETSTTMWDKMQQRMETMPENFPPRVLFDNVAATKANTDQILELLRAERPPHAEPVDAP